MDEFMLEQQYLREERDRNFLPDWMEKNDDELIKDDEIVSNGLNKDIEEYYPC